MLALDDVTRTALFRASAATCATAQSSRLLEPTEVSVAAPLVVPTVAPIPTRANPAVRVRDPFQPAAEGRANESGISPVLLAFASGTRSVALIEVNGRTLAIAIGDDAFGSRVVSMDARTMRLADGRTFAMRSHP